MHPERQLLAHQLLNHLRLLRPTHQVEPSTLLLPPGGTASVLVRYQPKALGNHTAAVTFAVVTQSAPGDGAAKNGSSTVVLAKEAVEVVGNCLRVGEKLPLPGGPEAIPETFIKDK